MSFFNSNYFVPTAEAGGGAVDAAAVAAAVWDYATRTLTSAQPAVVIPPSIAAGDISLRRGDTFNLTFTGLPSHASFARMWFAIKNVAAQADSQATALVVLSNPSDPADGLQVVLGAAATDPTLGALSYGSNTTLTVTLDAAATKLLTPATGKQHLFYDVQYLLADGTVETVAAGSAYIEADITRAVE